MKFTFLKFLKRDNTPPLKSLRPKIFRTDFFWFVGLGLISVIFIITALVGVKLFYYQYFESYKQSDPGKDLEKIINIDRIKVVTKQRDDFINRDVSLPSDPSF